MLFDAGSGRPNSSGRRSALQELLTSIGWDRSVGRRFAAKLGAGNVDDDTAAEVWFWLAVGYREAAISELLRQKGFSAEQRPRTRQRA
jgi:hypothetical protein